MFTTFSPGFYEVLSPPSPVIKNMLLTVYIQLMSIFSKRESAACRLNKRTSAQKGGWTLNMNSRVAPSDPHDP